MNRTLEDVFIDLVYEAAKDRFLELVKQHDSSIKQIVDELITPEFIKSQIQDMVVYDDILRDHLREIAMAVIDKNILEVLKPQIV
jgi:hypothetical protein